MKFLYLLPIALALTACGSVDPQVRLIGEYHDFETKSRYEVYVRKIPFSDHSTLKHADEPMVLSDPEIRSVILDIGRAEEFRSLIRAKVKKDIEAGVALDLDEIKKYEAREAKRFAEHEERLRKGEKSEMERLPDNPR